QAFTYTACSPSLTGLSPPSGPAGGGTQVTLTGSGFTAASVGTTVHFGAAATQVTAFIDAGHVLVTAPPGSGTVDVTLSNACGGSTLSQAFTYTACSPSL